MVVVEAAEERKLEEGLQQESWTVQSLTQARLLICLLLFLTLA